MLTGCGYSRWQQFESLEKNVLKPLNPYPYDPMISKTAMGAGRIGLYTPYIPFQKNTNESIYKLSDEYSLFYLKFIEHAKDAADGAWIRQYGMAAYTIWSGFAFESVCQKQVLQIRGKLGIEDVLTNTATWRHAPGKGAQGAQIDLLLDRQDRCINICEMKFFSSEFVINKKYAAELDTKVNVFRAVTGTKKRCSLL